MDSRFLGKRIREERLKLNLTQEKLSEDINITTAYLGQIERGERCITLSNLILLANRLGVTVDFLLQDYTISKDDHTIDTIRLLLHGRTEKEKNMVVNVIKIMLSYMD